MSNRYEQESRITNVAHSLEIDVTDSVELADQTFFLVSDREAKRISSVCFKRYAWFPVEVLSDVRLSVPGKGMKWIATEVFRPVDEREALSAVYGMTSTDDVERLAAIVEFLSDRPELLTTGQAQRGFAQLKNYVENA
jgi:hypothetical protein